MAMASAFVDEALQDIELVIKFRSAGKRARHLQVYLKTLRTFLLYARFCGGSAVESLLNRLEDSLIQNGKDFHNMHLGHKENHNEHMSTRLYTAILQLSYCITSFYEEIIESYIISLDYCSLQSCYQLKEFFDSLLVNMADFLMYLYRGESQDMNMYEAFKDKLEFFINFICFAELRGLEPAKLQFLLTRLHVVAVNAAILYCQWQLVSYGDEAMLIYEFKLKVFEPFLDDPQIHEIYVHILTASNVCQSSHALTLEKNKHVLGDFVDTLLNYILKALTYGDSYMVSLKDQVSILYEGLRFLRTILTKHLENIDELRKKAKDLIGAAINEAATVIYSLPLHELGEGSVKEMDFALLNFLERIKLIKIITSKFIFSKINEHGFIDFLLENMKELSSCKVDSIAFAKDQIQRVQEDLISLRSFLESILDNCKQNGELQSLWNRFVEVAYKTHFILLSLAVEDIPNCSLLEFRTIIKDIDFIKQESLKIVDNHYSSDSEAQKATNTSNPLVSECSTPAINKIEVTLDDEASTIIEHITGGSKKLDIISIVGMPGLGKTTLARSVYDNLLAKEIFHTSAWCVVSQTYKKKDLLLRILAYVDPDFSRDKYLEENEQGLEEKLKKCLLRRRYLIVLDDVWDIEAWSCLERSFPDDANSSRILLTSRDSEVMRKINPNREPHTLRPLTNDECWDLLQKKLFCLKSYPLDLGMKIAKNCHGLPLTIVIVAGILANSNQDDWERIVGRLSLSALSDTDQCMDILELSFKRLPENLKPCLLYFGSTPEDQEFSVRKLTWFWIAEGFIEKNEQKSLEDVAQDYMNDLISRNLVMVSRKKFTGDVKSCRIHDLLHEFCAIKANRKKFMSTIRGHDELFTFHGQRDLQRLCVHSTPKEFEKSKVSCPNVRSLLFFAADDDDQTLPHIPVFFHFFKLLKVLELRYIYLDSNFPSEIVMLVELRYLAIRGNFDYIPSAAANLSNLEFLLVWANNVFLPDTIWNMSKLRVLWSRCSYLLYAMDIDNLERSPDLHNLDTFSTLELFSGESLEKIMRKLPNIHKLKCQFKESGKSIADCNELVVMDFLSQLESLHLRRLPQIEDMSHIGFRFPKNLKKLTLSQFHSSVILKNGELPNLVVLKLQNIDFEEGTWNMNKEWQLPNLKFLELNCLGIDRWIGTDDVNHFPCLEKLALHNCWGLKEVPSCLRDNTTLQTIDVSHCPKSVVSLIMQIKEYQKNDWGNEDLQVLVTNTYE